MTIRERVIETVVAWSGVDDFSTSDPLANIWARSAASTAIPFKPQAVSDLIGRLRSAFSPPFVPSRNLSSWTPIIFAPPAGINTVDDLVSGVMAAPSGSNANPPVGRRMSRESETSTNPVQAEKRPDKKHLKERKK